ncbi:MAG: hypothetical protein L6Q70_12715 [Thauera sp.]|nr:hypothetical protein [Thauera sp.]
MVAEFLHRAGEGTDPLADFADVAGGLGQLFLACANGGEVRLGGGADRLCVAGHTIHRLADPAAAGEDLAGQLALPSRAAGGLADAQVEPCGANRNLRPAPAQLGDDLPHRRHQRAASARAVLADVPAHALGDCLDHSVAPRRRCGARARGQPEGAEGGKRAGCDSEPGWQVEPGSGQGKHASAPDQGGHDTGRIVRRAGCGHSGSLLKTSKSDFLG